MSSRRAWREIGEGEEKRERARARERERERERERRERQRREWEGGRGMEGVREGERQRGRDIEIARESQMPSMPAPLCGYWRARHI